MAETRFHSVLRKRIEELIHDRTEAVATGTCIDYAHYRFECGYLQGLADALKMGREIEAEDV